MHLFDEPILPGLQTVEAFVGEAEEQRFIKAIDAAGLAPFRFQGWLGERLTRSFGWAYDFDNGRFSETEPMPDGCRPCASVPSSSQRWRRANSLRRCSSAMIRARASAGTEIGRFSSMSSALVIIYLTKQPLWQ